MQLFCKEKVSAGMLSSICTKVSAFCGKGFSVANLENITQSIDRKGNFDYN